MSKTAQLQRNLKLIHVVAIGIAYMSPFAVFDTFGIASDVSSGHVPMAYIIVFIAILFTALSYGKLVKKYPTAGSVYTYTKNTINPYVGIIVGWVTFIAYLALPMINSLLAKIYLSTGVPGVPGWVWIVGLITIISILNTFGVKIAASINVLLVVFQFLMGAIFIYLNVRAIVEGPKHFISLNELFPANMEFSGVFAGAALLALSFIGFDAITTLSEETMKPKKTIPKAILLVASIGGVFFFSVTYFMQSLFPDVSVLQNIEGASPEIASIIGGNLFLSFFLAGALFSVFASGLAAQLSASRLLYALGRDEVIPKRFFGYLHPKFNSPIPNILLVGVLALSALFLDLRTATSLINVGAFTAFSFVNICVIKNYFKYKKEGSLNFALSNLIGPLIGLGFVLYLWSNLDWYSIIIGLIWALLGVLYLGVSTGLFKKEPPQIEFDELEG
ncbi:MULTISPECIES: APC family permease [Virgibacillus]|uniref:Putrescine importer PuuP n=1 Tax=Virgibacillus massiliensis TaxID=1462526 RepID=A0A024Q7A3_9BACI|nr:MULTISPECIES: amino acid permease [Virgibacillus]EQB38675.1 Putrescine importer PuuP [Virgibacillus sp. CM-4]MYL41389.1 amino acid permease [Virgibacillus massiliensis]CDQ37816.1 Putrescine importer PuuP [Virgibacillus massiliensis]